MNTAQNAKSAVLSKEREGKILEGHARVKCLRASVKIFIGSYASCCRRLDVVDASLHIHKPWSGSGVTADYLGCPNAMVLMIV